MDGSPSRGNLGSHVNATWIDADEKLGETIPIRLFLGGFDLTPTFREVNKKYSTRYYLSLVLIDEGMRMSHVLHTYEAYTYGNRCSPVLQAVRDRPLPTGTGWPCPSSHEGATADHSSMKCMAATTERITAWAPPHSPCTSLTQSNGYPVKTRSEITMHAAN